MRSSIFLVVSFGACLAVASPIVKPRSAVEDTVAYPDAYKPSKDVQTRDEAAVAYPDVYKPSKDVQTRDEAAVAYPDVYKPSKDTIGH